MKTVEIQILKNSYPVYAHLVGTTITASRTRKGYIPVTEIGKKNYFIVSPNDCKRNPSNE